MLKSGFSRALAALLACVVVLGGGAAAVAQEAAPRPTAPEIGVDEVAAQLAAGTVTVCDANGSLTRANYGTIPGALLLDGFASYEPSSLGPADGNYVFYCANVMCSAAPVAARRAMEAGFTNVSVLRVGIMGWVEAGQAVAAYEVPGAEEPTPGTGEEDSVTQ
jgi:rhodanese-related sulfurtransferase